MFIERIWSMPSKWTFTIKPIKELLEQEMNDVDAEIKKNKHIGWADPFAGYNSLAEITNDLDKETPTTWHLDALNFLGRLKDNSMIGVLYDPPYSITQARQYGKKEFASMKYWSECKNEIARIVKPCGKVICFGWNSMGLGKKRGFEMKRILLVCHGGSRNDTLVTVEVKK